MVTTYDAIVLGLGGFGSAALYHLAERGQRALGIDQFDLAHDRGSSHGESRMIRKAYFEHPNYVPLLERSFELWRSLEHASGRSLLHEIGLLLAGSADGPTITGARLAARLHGLRLDELPAAEVLRRFPGLQIDENATAVFEPEAGYLAVEECVRTHVEQAVRLGAVAHHNESVVHWQSRDGSVKVKTDKHEYHAGRLIVTAGAWSAACLAELQLPLQVLRKTLHWHAVRAGDYDVASGMPAYFLEFPPEDPLAGCFYGFPTLDGKTVKLSEHSGGDPVAKPAELDREVHDADRARIEAFASRTLPGVSREAQTTAVCMYTMTPDGHFIVDRHPEHEAVVFAAGFSGHGFKFASVLGAALADLALAGRTELPIGFLSLDRWSQPDRASG